MRDVDEIIAYNIRTCLKEGNRSVEDLQTALSMSTSEFTSLVQGSRLIPLDELEKIADFLGVPLARLTRIPSEEEMPDNQACLLSKAPSKQARKAMEYAFQLAEIYVFHKRLYDSTINGMQRQSSLID